VSSFFHYSTPLLTDLDITYKADTNQVVSWLAETGLKCGYSLKQAPQSRSNGKKRPQVRNENHSTKSLNTIPTHLFVPLAQHIAQARRKVAEMPRVVALSLDRAIRVRKEHNTVSSRPFQLRH